ncbi:hypothetical protein CEXT_581721 [Caerostris extrusa]|uniref:Uncharacterized protein n=1 Tax=Caerostris extrusa TaxID=172846 RepID=A0AAV4TXE9_CAEEX|nr:hypothetical protein CEXT_581721 [Caerostris extrusa]
MGEAHSWILLVPSHHADCPIGLQKTALRRGEIIHPFRGINQDALALCDEVPNELRPITLRAPQPPDPQPQQCGTQPGLPNLKALKTDNISKLLK